jgi:4-hydroxy-3-methylbut-2-enyl diphosphate reductase
MGESTLPTYFIKNAAKIVSGGTIQHFDLHQLTEIETRDWLPTEPATIGVTAGASCPNNLIEDVIRRLFELKGVSIQQLLTSETKISS